MQEKDSSEKSVFEQKPHTDQQPKSLLIKNSSGTYFITQNFSREFADTFYPPLPKKKLI